MTKAVRTTLKPTWRKQGALINKSTGEVYQMVTIEQFRTEPDRVQVYGGTINFFSMKVEEFDQVWMVEGVNSVAEAIGL